MDILWRAWGNCIYLPSVDCRKARCLRQGGMDDAGWKLGFVAGLCYYVGMFPDPLRMAIALVPLASYFLLIGLLNMRRRPLMTTGGSDLAVLGVAMSGLVLVGPIELFRPEVASVEFGSYVWLFLLVFYWLWVWLAVLLGRPRLVIYNISGQHLRPLLAEAAREVDPQSRWAGDSLSLPSMGVQLHIESSDWMRHTSIIAAGSKQNLAGWRQLAFQLQGRLAVLKVPSNPRALGLLSLGILLFFTSIWHMLSDPVQVALAIREIFSF